MGKKQQTKSNPVKLRIKEIKNFFYSYEDIDEKELIQILSYLYKQTGTKKLLTKFSEEIKLIVSGLENDMKKLKEQSQPLDENTQAVIDDLNTRLLAYESLGPEQKVIQSLKEKYINNKKQYDNYCENLRLELLRKNEKINHLVVYEAPPFAGMYILECSNQKDELAKISTYWSPIKDVLKNYVDTDTPTENMIKNNIGFIDLSLVPLPLKAIREDWSTSEEFNIGGKQLPVWLFEWAIEYFILKIGNQINSNPHIAIGIPNKTSVSIFDYYSNKYYINDYVSIDISKTNRRNEKEFYEEPVLKRVNLRLHKNNVTTGMGYPNGLLMKLALDLNIRKKKS
jgi:hypothetical protein